MIAVKKGFLNTTSFASHKSTVPNICQCLCTGLVGMQFKLTLNLEYDQVLTWTGVQFLRIHWTITWELKLYCRFGGSTATDSESVRELHLIGDLLCPQSSHLSCGCQTQQIEEAGTENSHISRSWMGMGGKTEGERELSVWMGAWFGLLEGWSTRVLKKSGKRRKTRENNVAKKREYNTVY